MNFIETALLTTFFQFRALDSEKTNSSYVMVIPKYGLSLYDFMYERQETLSFEEARRTYKKILKALCKLHDRFLNLINYGLFRQVR